MATALLAQRQEALLMKVLYTAEALATGDGRNGHTRTTDGKVDVDLSMPKAMGGDERGTNPEQLFAAGYAACFHGALRLVGGKAKADISDSAVGAKVSLGTADDGAFQLAVVLEVSLPHLSREQAQELAEAAHQVCPYSAATRGNIDVQVTVAED
jgi:Ohr subfamily peroxiredoxin